MNNLNFNPNQIEKDPLKKPIIITETNAIKDKSEINEAEQKDVKIILFGVILMLNRALRQIKEKPVEKKTNNFNEKSLLIVLLNNLKKLITELSQENTSQDIQFIKKLVESFQKLSDQLLLMSSLEKKTDFFIHSSLLINSISQYPADSPFTLGYYLKNYSGENWLPFPLMKILEQLHIESSTEEQNSHLAIWNNTIDELIDNLNI